jgi:tetratricopeptide (TPR) repeat protein
MRGTALLVVATLLLVPAAATGQTTDTAARATARPETAAVREASRALLAGDPDRALHLAGQHLRANPASVPARLVMARACIARDDYQAAYDHLRRAQRSSPRDVDVLYYMGLVAGRLAELELHRLAQVAPDSGRVHQVMAESLELQQRPHEAIAAYEAGLARQPDLFDALIGLGRLKRSLLQCDQAIPLYERAEALRPTYEGAYGLGMCLHYDQQDERAVAQFEAATRREPGAALAWQGLGLSLLKLRRLPEAISALQRATELEPRNHEAYYALGQAYRAAGDLDKARVAFATAQHLQQAQPPR